MNSKVQELVLEGTLTSIPSSNGNYGFAMNAKSLWRLVLPKSLNSIGSYSFKNCTALTNIIATWGNIKNISAESFFNCTSLSFEDLQLPNLETLGQNAFYGVKVKRMVLGKEGGSLTLPSGSGTTQNYGDKSVLEEIIILGNVSTIPQSSFRDYKALARIDIPSSVTTIEQYAFYGCPITAINLQNVSNLSGGNIFANTNIEVLDLPNIVTIGSSAITRMTKVKKIIIGEHCTSIGTYNFWQMASGITLVCKAIAPPSLGGNNNLSFCDAIYVPDASVTAYREASGWSAYADRIYPISVYNEGGLSEQIAFEDPAVEAACLANFDYNNNGYISKAEAASVTSLGTAFKENTEIVSFNELEYFTGLVLLNEYAFSGCSNLTKINLLNVRTVSNNVFEKTGITELLLPNVEKLSYGALIGMKKIDKIVIGSNCTSISGNNIWSWTDGGKVAIIIEATIPPSITTSNNRPDWYGVTFYVKDEVVDNYKSASGWASWADRIKPLSEYVE